MGPHCFASFAPKENQQTTLQGTLLNNAHEIVKPIQPALSNWNGLSVKKRRKFV